MNNRITIRWGIIPAVVFILVGALTSSARTWTGAGTSPYASEAANWSGGGAVWLTVKGPAIIDGTISAQAQQPTGLSGGSGGSILIEAVSLTGSTNGLIDVSVPYHAWGSSQRNGGGGRIAVILTGSSSFGSVQMRAHGGDKVLRASLYDSMWNGSPPLVGVDEALRSAIVCLGIDQALDEGRVVDLRPLWKKADIAIWTRFSGL
jgi:hypothetical protein